MFSDSPSSPWPGSSLPVKQWPLIFQVNNVNSPTIGKSVNRDICGGSLSVSNSPNKPTLSPYHDWRIAWSIIAVVTGRDTHIDTVFLFEFHYKMCLVMNYHCELSKKRDETSYINPCIHILTEIRIVFCSFINWKHMAVMEWFLSRKKW